MKHLTRRLFLGTVVGTAVGGRHMRAQTSGGTQSAAGITRADAPAALGGTPVRRTAFPSWPVADAPEEEALLRVLRGGRWNRGDQVTAFETAYGALTGAKHCLATA